MSIAAVIVNYNAGEALQECVNALMRANPRPRLTVIDNASSDQSAQKLRNLYGDRQGIEFLFNPVNMGFGPAVNRVARQADTDWVLILNPDCVLEDNALRELQAALANDPAAALAGPAVYDENGRFQRATVRRFPDPWKSLVTASGLWRLGKWLPRFEGIEVDASKLGDDVRTCDAVSGACMLVRTSALASVGFLDEKYAMHCEDLDLMYRLKEQGLHCLFVPRAGCVHLQGVSSRSRLTWVHFQKHRGMARFFRKFQADRTFVPLRMLVYAGIWLKFIVSWPLVLIRR